MAACPQMFPLTSRYVELLIILLMLFKPAPCMSKCGSRVTFRTVKKTCRLGGSLVHVQTCSNQAVPTQGSCNPNMRHSTWLIGRVHCRSYYSTVSTCAESTDAFVPSVDTDQTSLLEQTLVIQYVGHQEPSAKSLTARLPTATTMARCQPGIFQIIK
jgi:hypothetical protein